MGDGFQLLDILFFAMIAVFLVMRLRNVLGRRTGHERRRDQGAGEAGGEKVVSLPDRSRPERASESAADESAPEPPADPLQAGLARIRAAGRDFDPDQFLAGARAAFDLIVNAFAASDTATLRPLLSDEVFENFDSAIKARAKAKHTLETTVVGLRSAEIIEAELQGRIALVTVKIVSEQVNVTRDAEGSVVEGDPTAVAVVTDIWTFARNTRARDPNWTLVATRSPN